MKRTVQRVAGVVAVLFAGVALLLVLRFWLRSHTRGDFITYYERPSSLELYSSGGLLSVGWGELVSDDYPPPTGWEGTFWPFAGDTRFKGDLSGGTWLGFGYERDLKSRPGLRIDARLVTVPYWSLAVAPLAVVGVAGWIGIRSVRARRRGSRGHCSACGYDLRASPGRCPECGTAAVARQT